MSETELFTETGYRFKWGESIPLLAKGVWVWRLDEQGQPHQIMFGCPCGDMDTHHGGMRVAGPGAWQWNGNVKRPTLRPSILNNPCGWHGYLVRGVLVLNAPTDEDWADRREEV